MHAHLKVQSISIQGDNFILLIMKYIKLTRNDMGLPII